jgi:hypothetical protein
LFLPSTFFTQHSDFQERNRKVKKKQPAPRSQNPETFAPAEPYATGPQAADAWELLQYYPLIFSSLLRPSNQKFEYILIRIIV